MTEKRSPLVSKQHAARLAGVNVRTIKRWADAGRLRMERDPRTGRPWYSQDDLNKIIGGDGG